MIGRSGGLLRGPAARFQGAPQVDDLGAGRIVLIAALSRLVCRSCFAVVGLTVSWPVGWRSKCLASHLVLPLDGVGLGRMRYYFFLFFSHRLLPCCHSKGCLLRPADVAAAGKDEEVRKLIGTA